MSRPTKRSQKKKRKRVSAVPDARARAVRTTDGEYLERLEPLRQGEELLLFQAPLAPALNLDVARRLRDRGRTARRRALRQTQAVTSPLGVGRAPTDAVAVFEALSQLSAGVVLAFAAIEAFANEVIELLPKTAAVIPEGRKKPVERAKMARSLRLRDKLELALPLVEQVHPLSAHSPLWDSFQELKDLRDELVHLKERGASNDPDAPSPYGRLILGDGDHAPECAGQIIDALWPRFLPERVRAALLLSGE